MRDFKWLRNLRALVVPVIFAGVAVPAVAAVPTTSAMEGVLLSSGGAAAADGNYTAAVAIYVAETGGSAVWSESGVTLAVKGGQFSYQLGTKTPLSAAALSAQTAWIGIQIGTDPELPRKALGSSPFALRAAVAEALECSGCLKAGHLDAGILQAYAKSSDLTAYAKTADLSAYAKSSDLSAYAKTSDLSGYAKSTDLGDYVKAASLAKVAGTGSYSDLKDLPTLAKVATSGSYADLSSKPALPTLGSACGTGLFLKGIKADGSYDCASVWSDIPADALLQVSGGTLTNYFVESVPSTGPFDVKDADPTGSSTGVIIVPDLGTALDVAVTVDIATKDASGLVVKLYDPTSKEHILYDKSKTGTTLTFTVKAADTLSLGGLKPWVGQNLKGQWILSVADIKGTSGQIDGQVKSWGFQITMKSNGKVAATGNLVLSGSTQPCTVYAKGAVRWNAGVNGIQVCDGAAWFPRALGSDKDTPGLSCRDIKDKFPSAKSGTFWLDPDGSGSGAAYAAYCDQETGGGGWTLVAKVKGNDATMNRKNTAQWRNKTPISGQDCSTTQDENAICESYDKVGFSDVMIRSLAKAQRNLAWGHRDSYKSAWDVVNAGTRVYTNNRLFGAVNNLDYNGDPIYHRDCGSLSYGFFTADWTQNYNGIAGHAIVHGHAGGVIGASLNDWASWTNGKSYGPSSLSTLHCLSDFSLGGCYDNCNNGGNDTYAINSHWWGNGNEYTWNWNSHGFFVR